MGRQVTNLVEDQTCIFGATPGCCFGPGLHQHILPHALHAASTRGDQVTPASPCLNCFALQTLFPYDSPVSALVAAISRLRSSASGANDDRGLLGDGGAFIVAPADNNAVAFSRTPAQVREPARATDLKFLAH